MKTDISGIAKNILQVRANLKAGASDKNNNQDPSVSFMELMNRNGLPNMNISSDTKKNMIGSDLKKSSGLSYDTYAASGKNVSVKESMTPEEMQSAASDSVETYEAEIRKILKEELGLTDEEITEAMENLGMNFLDLRNLQNLTSLVQALTGEDIGTLFSSEAFQNVMVQVSELTEALCAELGISKEDLNELCEAWKQMEMNETSDPEAGTTVKDTKEVPDMAQNQDAALQQEADAGLPEEDAVLAHKEGALGKDDAGRISEDIKNSQQVSETSGSENGADAKEQSFSEQFQNAKPDAAGIDVAVAQQQTVRSEEFILPQEVPLPYASQADAYDLIDQIAKNVRVSVSGLETSMEMQLNPEHLGKIYLNITEKEGAVRAQIMTQNTVVKEALETQLVELRQSLNQQGIKVDAIEVTVSTHEFEQNLEQNARHEEQMRQQMEESQKQTRRNLNLNDLDGLTGLMTEEEQLAAQIMRDNGNQVDLTA